MNIRKLQRRAEPHDYRLPHNAEIAVQEEKWGNVEERCGVVYSCSQVEVLKWFVGEWEKRKNE